MRHVVTIYLLTALAGFSACHAANAATQTRHAQHHTANMCQLSKPTTNATAWPRATGFLNEGSTTIYVICGYPSPEGGYGTATEQRIILMTLDGQPHSIDCTGVAGMWPGSNDTVFVTKNITTSHSAELGGDFLVFLPEDFNLPQGSTLPASFSITCKLPAQTGINDGYTTSTTNVGN
ncbi:hypothetical protein FNZ56_03570 [Pseudoluteimonas lycopersici]|uniref:Uncharacterized protein n=1 Tax=Pseudoluteimonas lycopersici TaxID=1324796 RepID=A0A516V3A1_9GAMM|nr:hypothetical protein [Lysobacter lycopersici]QDQ73011.1 hypothetical protein FNZ56_03570 [Lysobacter lycopersici]